MKGIHYRPGTPRAWKGRSDNAEEERIFQTVKLIDARDETARASLKEKAYALIGFACDTGITRNQGREGARLGPQVFRKYFGNLALKNNAAFELYDLGDIHCDDDDLAEAQSELASLVQWTLEQKLMPVLVGGGHEISWGGYSGAFQALPNQTIGIINFDAHFDLRPLMRSGANSGTPFTQIAELCSSHNKEFKYQIIGLQPASNTISLFERAETLKVRFITAEQIERRGLDAAIAAIEHFIKECDHLYLTICLDVLAQAYAPGVSAPQPLGLTPSQVLPLLKYVMSSGKVLMIDMAELSPPLDEGDKTARLAAYIMQALL